MSTKGKGIKGALQLRRSTLNSSQIQIWS